MQLQVAETRMDTARASVPSPQAQRDDVLDEQTLVSAGLARSPGPV